MLEIARKAIADSSFRMDAVTEEESENNDKESVAVKTDEDGEATTEKKEEKNQSVYEYIENLRAWYIYIYKILYNI